METAFFEIIRHCVWDYETLFLRIWDLVLWIRNNALKSVVFLCTRNRIWQSIAIFIQNIFKGSGKRAVVRLCICYGWKCCRVWHFSTVLWSPLSCVFSLSYFLFKEWCYICGYESGIQKHVGLVTGKDRSQSPQDCRECGFGLSQPWWTYREGRLHILQQQGFQSQVCI